MQSTLRLMAAEARELRPGGEAVITRLADILVIQAIRSWIETDPAAQTGWLGALQDPQIGRAISLIHRDPARDWTVAALADELAMSRSAFAARFTELVGEPAMQYVTRWRMHVALTTRCSDQGATVAELAAPPRLPLRGRVRARVQARHRRAARRGQARRPGGAARLSGRATRSAPAPGSSNAALQPPSWETTASSSHRPLWVKRTVVAPSLSSNSISIS